MSDNPNENDLLNLNVNVEAGSLETLPGLLQTVQQSVGQLDQALSGIGTNTALAQQLNAIATSAQQSTQALSQETQQIQGVGQAASAAAAQIEELAAAQQSASGGIGSGEFSEGGGGSAEAPEAGGGGGSVGSLFGIAHGVRAASGLGRLAGLGNESTAAFTGGADVLYLIQGFRSLQKILPDINSALEATGGLFPALTEGLVALGVPMAGLIAVAAPIVLVLGDVALALRVFDDETKKLTESIGYAARTAQGYRDITKGTGTEGFKGIEKQGQTVEDASAEAARLKDYMDDAWHEAVEKWGDAGARIALSRSKDYNDAVEQYKKYQQQILDAGRLVSEGFKAIQDGATQAADASEKAAKNIEALGVSYQKDADEHAKAFDQALEAQKQKDEIDKQAAQHSIQQADEKAKLTAQAEDLGLHATVDSIDKLIDKNKDKIKQNEEEIANLNQLRDAAGPLSEVWDVYGKKIDALREENGQLANQTALLTNEELPLAQARAAETAAAKELEKAIKADEAAATKTANDIQKMADLKDKFDAETAKIAEDRFIKDSRADSDFALKRSQQQADFQTKQSQEEEDHARERANKIAAFTASISDIENKSHKARIDDIEKFNEENAQKAIEFNRKIQDINSQSHDTILEAASRLDARAVYQEEKKRNQQIEQATQSYEDEKAKRQQALDQKLKDLDDNTKAEEDKRIAAFNTELKQYDDQYATKREREEQAFRLQQQREDEAHRIADQRRQEDYARQDRERTTFFVNQIKSIIGHNTTLEGLQNTSQASILDSASTFWAQMRSLALTSSTIAQGGITTVSQAQTLGLTSRFSPQTLASHGFAEGTSRVPDDGLSTVHPGEIVGAKWVGDIARSFLGENFTQPQLAGAIAGGAGGGSGGFTWSGDVNLNGDIGNLDPSQIRALMKDAAEQAMKSTFEKYRQQTRRY